MSLMGGVAPEVPIELIPVPGTPGPDTEAALVEHAAAVAEATAASTAALAAATTAAAAAVVAAGAGISTRRGMWSSGSVNGTNNSLTNILQRVPVRLPATTTRWRFRYRAASGHGTLYTGATTLTGLYIGVHDLDSDGAATGNFTATPTQILSSTALPSDASEYVSAWVTDEGKQFTSGVEHLLSMGFTCSGGHTWARSAIAGSKYDGGGAALVGNQTMTVDGTAGLFGDIRIEYEVDTAHELVAFVGDSLTDGLLVELGQIGSWPSTLTSRTKQPWQHAALSGITAQSLAGYTGTDDWFWQRTGMDEGLIPTAAVVFAGTNDLNVLRTAAQIKADLATIYATLRDFGIERIYGATLIPRGWADADAKELARQEVNAWLRGRPHGLIDVFDFDRAVRDPAVVEDLDAIYDAGDGVHLSTAGAAALAHVVPGTL